MDLKLLMPMAIVKSNFVTQRRAIESFMNSEVDLWADAIAAQVYSLSFHQLGWDKHDPGERAKALLRNTIRTEVHAAIGQYHSQLFFYFASNPMPEPFEVAKMIIDAADTRAARALEQTEPIAVETETAEPPPMNAKEKSLHDMVVRITKSLTSFREDEDEATTIFVRNRDPES